MSVVTACKNSLNFIGSHCIIFFLIKLSSSFQNTKYKRPDFFVAHTVVRQD